MIDTAREAALKEQIATFYCDLGGRPDNPRIARLLAEDYQPHCAPLPGVPELKHGIGALRRRLADRGPVTQTPYRMIADGDYVFTHLRYDGAVPIAGIDIFRFDADDRIAGVSRNAGDKSRNADIFRIDGNNKLVEHWDVLQMQANLCRMTGHCSSDAPTSASQIIPRVFTP
jgi:predicted SnoaL-like aldol condensation-catalyzing enzyme